VRAAWLQVSDGISDVRAVVKTADDFVHVGGVVAKAGCWSMLKGGLTATSSGRAELYFEVRKKNEQNLHQVESSSRDTRSHLC
jgi:hypothetical protein